MARDSGAAIVEACQDAKEQALALMKERHDNYEKIGKAMRAVSFNRDAAILMGIPIDRIDLATWRSVTGSVGERAARL